MHKRFFNEAIIEFTIAPTGPVLIKAGEGASDPTKPDMSFVRTMRNGGETIYLPGSSLKGVLRAHCERLARTVQAKRRLACDPVRERECDKQFEGKKMSAADVHRRSCFLCQLFGNTALASHFRISDAYPVGACHTEERNGVAIDRVFGSVAHGPFNYETVTAGSFETQLNLFKTTLHLKNFTLAQVGLLALALRDLTAERVRLGFGKSRGLGTVTARVNAMLLRYPLCELQEGKLRLIDGRELGDAKQIFGVGAFTQHFPEDSGYGYQVNDIVPLEGYEYSVNEWDEVEIRAPQADSQADWQRLGRVCVGKWKEVVNDGRRE
jgi:CRISPR-associated RAMP protein (TIGR02581 family)